MINDILAEKDFNKVLAALCLDPLEKDKAIDDNRKAYMGDHEILHDTARLPKTVGTGKNARVVKHTSETIPFQKRIVNSAVTFLFGEPVSLVLNNDKEEVFKLIQDLWKKCKLYYFDKRLARDLFVETKAAELWSVVKAVDGVAKARVTLLSKRESYLFYPHYDEYGDMDAFTVTYKLTDEKGKPVDHANIYTASQIITAIKGTAGWTQKTTPNLFGKIPVVYYEQDDPEWEDVKTEINRLEYLISNFGDANDYNGSPITEIKGEVDNMPKKEDVGKVVRVKKEENSITGEVTYPGGVRYVSWDQAPESIKLEIETLKDIIYGMTNTPDLSFSNVKGMSAVSGIALRLMFSDALFKAKDKQEIFGEGMERRISVMKSVLGVIDKGQAKSLDEADIDVVFNDVLPEDLEALIRSLSLARGGEPIMSQKSAVDSNPLIQDATKELEELEKESGALKSFAESVNI